MRKTIYSLTFGLGASLWAGTALADGVTLRALMEDVPETSIIEKMLPQFEKETGIKVEFEKVGYGDMHDKLVAQLVSGESDYNLLEVDFLWAGEFPAAGWLEDLKPYAEKSGFDIAAFIPSTMDLLGNREDFMPLVPMYNYSMGLIYRTDLLSDPELKSAYKSETSQELEAPKTLEEYVRIAKFMKAQATSTAPRCRVKKVTRTQWNSPITCSPRAAVTSIPTAMSCLRPKLAKRL